MAQVSAQKCSLCDENTGVYYCYECQHALCTVCRKNHGKISALSEHTLADINIITRSILNKRNQCVDHNKEIQIYCEECSDLICIKCVTTTHKSHTISDISDVVVEEREKARENIEKLKLKTEAISSLQEKIRREHIAKLHVESEKCMDQIESVCKDLKTYIGLKGSIKTTEVEDNITIENQNFEAFLKSTDLIHKRYVNILSELENLVLEKHDVTFYSGYRSVQRDIETLDSIPEEPPFARVPIFDDEGLYREATEHMASKMDKSLCQNCPVQKKQIEDLQSEYNICKETFHREIETKDAKLEMLSEDLKALKEENYTMQSTFTEALNKKEAENKKLSNEIDCLNKDIEKKNAETEKLSQEIQSSMEANKRFTEAINKKDAENKKLSDTIDCLNKDIKKKNAETEKLSQEIQSSKEAKKRLNDPPPLVYPGIGGPSSCKKCGGSFGTFSHLMHKCPGK